MVVFYVVFSIILLILGVVDWIKSKLRLFLIQSTTHFSRSQTSFGGTPRVLPNLIFIKYGLEHVNLEYDRALLNPGINLF